MKLGSSNPMEIHANLLQTSCLLWFPWHIHWVSLISASQISKLSLERWTMPSLGSSCGAGLFPFLWTLLYETKLVFCDTGKTWSASSVRCWEDVFSCLFATWWWNKGGVFSLAGVFLLARDKVTCPFGSLRSVQQWSQRFVDMPVGTSDIGWGASGSVLSFLTTPTGQWCFYA